MKPLKPSMREKKRYLLVRLSQARSDSSKLGQTRGKNLKENIPKAIQEFIGTFGMSKTSLSFIKTKKDYAVICINREMLDKVRASLCIWPEKMEVKRVSGTIKGLASVRAKNNYKGKLEKSEREGEIKNSLFFL